jgi:hypothetical protein
MSTSLPENTADLHFVDSADPKSPLAPVIQYIKNLLKKWADFVSRSEDRLFHGPCDLEIGIIPPERVLRGRIIGRAYLIVDESCFAQDGKAMGETDRNE